MALSTYTELKSSLADWLNRSDLTSVIPDFISLAEAQIERQLRTRQMIVRATASFAAAAEYGTVPDDFLEAKAIKLNTNPVTNLTFQTIDAMDSLSNTTYLSSGKPLYFSVVGNQGTWYPWWYGPIGVVSLFGRVVSNSIPKAIWFAFISVSPFGLGGSVVCDRHCVRV